MFKKGDRIRVLVDNADTAEVSKGDEFIVKRVNPEGEEDWVEVTGRDGWWLSFENIELVEQVKKDEITPKTETQPMAVNINIGAELTNITIGGKRFRLVSED